MPWNSVESLANSIAALKRQDLLDTWDRMVMDKRQRSRVVSMVYGSKFPLDTKHLQKRPTGVVVMDMPCLFGLREKLGPYQNVARTAPASGSVLAKLQSFSGIRPSPTLLAAAAVGVAAGIAVTRMKRK